MSSSKYEAALIKRSLEGFKADYSQPPLDAYVPKDDKGARKRLPAKNKHKTISVYTILKHAIGKDLTHITMPLIINEPLSLLQRLAETLEYAFLLSKADAQSDPVLRMELVMAFCVSCLSTSKERLLKPFNPLLGETFQWEKPGYKLVSEQVSHHPPVSAFHVDGDSYTMYANLQPAIKFWGRSIEIQTKGMNVVRLHKNKEVYVWEAVPVLIKNLIIGPTYLEYGGTYALRKLSSGMKASIAFKGGSKPSLESSYYEGALYENGVPVRIFKGYWYDHMVSIKADADAKLRIEFRYVADNVDFLMRLVSAYSELWDFRDKVSTSRLPNLRKGVRGLTGTTLESSGNLEKRILFRVRPKPPTAYDYFNFGYYTLMLNELTAEVKKTLCPTDSRWRPDMRLLEQGKEDEAQLAKNRIEDNQRMRRRAMENGTMPKHKPRWFELRKDPNTGLELWMYKEESKFWESDYKDVPDLWK